MRYNTPRVLYLHPFFLMNMLQDANVDISPQDSTCGVHVARFAGVLTLKVVVTTTDALEHF